MLTLKMMIFILLFFETKFFELLGLVKNNTPKPKNMGHLWGFQIISSILQRNSFIVRQLLKDRNRRKRRFYLTDLYPPATPLGDKTICQSWPFRDLKTPAHESK